MAGIVGVYKQHAASGACSLGDAELLELAPASIQNSGIQARLGRCPIGQIVPLLLRVRLGFGRLAHVGDLQVFKHEQPKPVDQGACGLVVEVFPLVPHLAMRLCQRDRRAFTAVAALLFPVLGLLQPLQALQAFAVEPGVLNGLAGREGRKMQQAHIKAHGLFTGRQWLLFHFTGESDLPVIHVALDRAGFHLAQHRTMQSNFDVPDFSEGEDVPERAQSPIEDR